MIPINCVRVERERKKKKNEKKRRTSEMKGCVSIRGNQQGSFPITRCIEGGISLKYRARTRVYIPRRDIRGAGKITQTILQCDSRYRRNCFCIDCPHQVGLWFPASYISET